MKKRLNLAIATVATLAPICSAGANNLGENVAWQFLTSQEQATRIYMEEVRQRRLNGYYSAPVYNTYIDRQYNCSVNSTATGNDSASNAVANSPSTTGHNADATGNQNDTTETSGNLASGGNNTTEQANTGEVEANSGGSISTSVRGDNFQALNTDQVNSGNQSSTINGSTACQYASAG